MCGIAGFTRVHGSGQVPKKFFYYFCEVLSQIAQRGPDSFGIGIYPSTRIDTLIKHPQLPGNNLRTLSGEARGVITHTTALICSRYESGYVLAGFRGVPTTEFHDDSDDCVQPYTRAGNAVTHNGMIANDKELAQKYGYRPPLIDSYVLLDLLTDAGIPHTADALSLLQSGSAIAMYDGEMLILARNFRGLALAVWSYQEQTFLVWASEVDALRWSDSPKVDVVAADMPPWSYFRYNAAELWQKSNSPSFFLQTVLEHCVRFEPQAGINDNKCAVVCSGGLDSVTVAALACQQFHEVHLLHFLYGARAEIPEKQAVQSVHVWLNEHTTAAVSLQFIDLSFIKDLGGSTLTEHDREVASGELGVETAHEWVPARNTAMIGLAASYCDRYGIGNIALGLNMEEASVYSDNSQEFFSRMEQALQFGTMSRPRLWMPLANCMKHHVVKIGLENDAPLHLSWSCYHGGNRRCGRCGPCIMRRRGFQMNGLEDQLEYEHEMP